MVERMQQITDVVSTYFGVSLEDILGRSKRANIVLARHFAVYHCYKSLYPAVTLGEIGAFFRRDHSTMHHAIESVRDRLVNPYKGKALAEAANLPMPDFSIEQQSSFVPAAEIARYRAMSPRERVRASLNAMQRSV